MMYVIKIIYDDQIIEKTLTESESIIIGREEADVVIPNKYISRTHCKLYVRQNNLYIEDLGSLNGTYVNQVRIEKYSPQIITQEDTIQLTKQGIVKLKVHKAADYGQAEVIRIPSDKGVITIGRADDNDIVIKLPTISKYHARIIKEGNKLYIEDLNSLNGTFVNGERVYGKVEIEPGSKISLGSHILRIESYEKLTHSSLIKEGLELKGIKLSYSIKGKYILKDVNFIAYGGELIGIIGPSGGGKTTLLNILAGLCPNSEGKVILNQYDLYENFDYLCVNIGYAPQDDIVHSELTVFQSLYYTARLRLPHDTTEEERIRRVETVMRELGISHIKDTQIGSPEKKIISGGERKRVNIGQELIVDPPLLFLDEPVTGLDPDWRRDVVEHLRKLANSGKIVVVVTHDIRDKESASYFDKIVVIAGGKEIYFGPADELFTFFNKRYVDEIFKELNDPIKREEWYKKFISSKYYASLVKKLAHTAGDRNYQNFKKPKKRGNSFAQFVALTSRYIVRKVSDKLQTLFLLLQAPLIGSVLSFLFKKSESTLLLLLGVSGIWFGLFNSMREIVSEKAIYKREKKAGVGILPYVCSKTFVLGLLAVFQAITLITATGIRTTTIWEHFPLLFLIILLSILSSTTLGLFLSSFIPRQEAIIPLIAIIVIFQLVFCGMLKPLNEMPQIMRPFVDIIPARWTMEGIINAVGEENIRLLCGFGPNIIVDIVVLVGFTVLFFILTNLSLQMKEE